ncbi:MULTISPECIES: enoyl-CoA-hydratase DpgB [unclassified Nocardia]|uniref:enoyl-CoA-hydratase DpgB n=1 Tax=unclassified Nocardia TaxID=2637762 RepID=UPI003656D6C7
MITTEVAADGALAPELTASVLAAAVRAEDASAAGGECAVVLRIGGAAPGARFAWPGPVSVGDVNKWEGALRRLEQVPAPVIALVDGDAYGPAAELLLVADYRIMAAGTVFELAASDGGVWPAMAVYRLAGQAGGGPARELAVLGRALSAERARDCGLVDAVIEPGADADSIAAGAALFGAVSGIEIAIRRRLLLDAPSTRFEDALGAHLAASDRALRRERAAS